MKLKTITNTLLEGQLSLMLSLMKTNQEFYRVCFINTAITEGIYQKMAYGAIDYKALHQALNLQNSEEALKAWLNLGVSLGELKEADGKYTIKGSLSKKLSNPDNDAYVALLQEVVDMHYNYIMQTPKLLKQQKKFPFDEEYGRLIARSSRTIEPVIFAVVDSVVPTKGDFNLLEVGCGSAVYIKKACDRNPSLKATGLELQAEVAKFAEENIKNWQLANRVTIKTGDVRQYEDEAKFDLVTLHNNIYYFAVEERSDLARHLLKYLKPGGQLLITTGGQGGNPLTQVLNLWSVMTEGTGALPDPDELCEQLKAGGFTNVQAERLIPFESFWAFTAQKPS